MILNKEIKILFLLLIFFVIIGNTACVFAANVGAKDIINSFEKGWDEKYSYDTATRSRNYVNNTFGKTVLNKIDKEYKNIHIKEDDLKDFSKKQKNALFLVLYVKWNELGDSEKSKYRGKDYFNFDGIYTAVNQDETDEKFNSLTKDTIYSSPDIIAKNSSSESLDDMINDADKFVKKGTKDKIKEGELAKFSGMIYNIVLQVGIAIAVIVGIVLGIQFMLSGIDGRADVKKALKIYVIGCVLIFGAFGIWKIVVEILKQI